MKLSTNGKPPASCKAQFVSLAALATAMLGCVHAPVVYPPIAPLYYSLSYERSRNADLGALPRQSQPLAKDTSQALRRGRRVAFLPPDSCSTETVSPSGAQEKGTSILMRCGALLASLEAEVARAGYSVVSWQAMKSRDASLDRARSLGVDVLFEVNQLSQEVRTAGQSGLSNLRFASHTGPGAEKPIAVSREVARRCGDQILGAVEPGTEYLSTVNLKATEVSSGRAVWLYQNTVVELVGGQTSSTARKRYYLAQGTRPPPPEIQSAPGALVPGILFTSVGGPLTLAGIATSADGEEAGPTLMGVGAVALSLGIGLLVLEHHLTEPSREVPATSYPEPAEVLCRGTAVADPWAPNAERPEAQDHYSYDIARSSAPGRDEARERSDRLTRKSAEDFVTALVNVVDQPNG